MVIFLRICHRGYEPDTNNDKKIWADYDKEADILYMHFKKPNHADNSEITEDDIIIRYEKGEIIGLSMLNASKRLTE